MADLTLDEYRDVPEDELRRILKVEARKMFGSDSSENNFEEIFTTLYIGRVTHKGWSKETRIHL